MKRVFLFLRLFFPESSSLGLLSLNLIPSILVMYAYLGIISFSLVYHSLFCFFASKHNTQQLIQESVCWWRNKSLEFKMLKRDKRKEVKKRTWRNIFGKETLSLSFLCIFVLNVVEKNEWVFLFLSYSSDFLLFHNGLVYSDQLIALFHVKYLIGKKLQPDWLQQIAVIHHWL